MHRHKSEFRFVKVAAGNSDTLVGGANLENDACAALQLRRRQPTLAHVEPNSGVGCALLQRFSSRPRNRAITHTLDVEKQLGDEGVPCTRTNGQRLRWERIALKCCAGTIDK